MTEQLTQAQINELLKSMTHVYSARIQIVLLINSTTYGIDSKCVSLNHKQAMSFPGDSGKESACQAGDMGLIPGSGRSPGE